MTALRERIEARRAALLSERAVAEAATPGPWTTEVLDDGDPPNMAVVRHDHPGVPANRAMRTRTVVAFSPLVFAPPQAEIVGNVRHIALQDPARTIARIDRELAGCAADLALLTYCENRTSNSRIWPGYPPMANLLARYPEEGTA